MIDLFFDDGGGTVVQTVSYTHYYADPADAAGDYKRILAGAEAGEWEGNEPEFRLDPSEGAMPAGWLTDHTPMGMENVSQFIAAYFSGVLDPSAHYMHPQTGAVQTGADWLADCADWEGDLESQLRSLILVTDENGEWTE